MVVQHNLRAMNSNRMLGITAGTQAKSSEKLSSGYKINRAADDAAGLSISEKMRRQIRGLTQASNNAEDGISAVQTAEGALTEVHDMLQRMNELATKAANGTMSEDDRQNVQDEINQLTTEIDRVSTTTKFNETYLLNGADDTTTMKSVTLSFKDAGLSQFFSVNTNTSITTYTRNVAKGDVTQTEMKIKLDMDKITVNGNSSVKNVIIGGKAYEIHNQVKGADGQVGAKTTIDLGGKVGTQTIQGMNGNQITTSAAATLIMYALQEANKVGDTVGTGNAVAVGTIDNTTAQFTVTFGSVQVKNDLAVSLHVGADSDADNKIAFNISKMDSEGLGIKNLSVTGNSPALATYAIDNIEAAIKKVSQQRSNLGAIQNRLEHTIKNLDNVVENTTAAESQIRDTDMASEMVKYSNNNILQQAGQSMLAQANQSNQGVLSLLG